MVSRDSLSCLTCVCVCMQVCPCLRLHEHTFINQWTCMQIYLLILTFILLIHVRIYTVYTVHAHAHTCECARIRIYMFINTRKNATRTCTHAHSSSYVESSSTGESVFPRAWLTCSLREALAMPNSWDCKKSSTCKESSLRLATSSISSWTICAACSILDCPVWQRKIARL